MNIITLFCKIDDFFLGYALLETRGRRRSLHPSEGRTLKHFYLKHVCVYWGDEFPHLVSYSRFVQLHSEVLTLLTDAGCDNRRISSHRVLSMGWFYGFKLHLAMRKGKS